MRFFERRYFLKNSSTINNKIGRIIRGRHLEEEQEVPVWITPRGVSGATVTRLAEQRTYPRISYHILSISVRNRFNQTRQTLVRERFGHVRSVKRVVLSRDHDSVHVLDETLLTKVPLPFLRIETKRLFLRSYDRIVTIVVVRNRSFENLFQVCQGGRRRSLRRRAQTSRITGKESITEWRSLRMDRDSRSFEEKIPPAVGISSPIPMLFRTGHQRARMNRLINLKLILLSPSFFSSSFFLLLFQTKRNLSPVLTPRLHFTCHRLYPVFTPPSFLTPHFPPSNYHVEISRQ